MTTPTLITRDYNGMSFKFRPDGWFNMTKAAAHFGKDLSNFMRSTETREYCEALNSVISTELVQRPPGATVAPGRT